MKLYTINTTVVSPIRPIIVAQLMLQTLHGTLGLRGHDEDPQDHRTNAMVSWFYSVGGVAT